MNINRINEANITVDAINSRNAVKAEQDEKFQESLMKNMGAQTSRQEILSPSLVQTKESVENISLKDSFRLMNQKTIERPEAVKGTEVKYLPYMHCDRVRVNVLEGYVMKAKMEESGEGAYPFVYVETKYDDGRIEACRVEVSKIPKGTQNPMEQIAEETAELSGGML